MSSWPLISDFARMIQNPQVGFRNPDLKQCTVELNQLGQPKARSGNFATVYRGYRVDGSEFAIRVFNRRQDERLDHYRTISEYLESRSISSIVEFEYDDRGIRSAGDGKMYPLLTMQWVPGITLFEWIRDRSREGYSEALQIAGEVWLHLVRELIENDIVHGDLQHGNVMVSPQGHFKLVDYDCMCVPSLIGRRNLETGMVPYQHPGRNADTILFPGLDNFSSLVIYVALRALAANPYLWITYVDQPEYDRVLFRYEDFENPHNSALYRDLMNSPDEQVRDLTHYLFELSRYDLKDVPPVDEVLLWCESVESLVSERQWDKVVQLVQRMGPGEQIAPEMQPFVQEAQQRVACRRAIEEALERGDEQRVAELYATGWLNNYPEAAHLIEPASKAAAVAPVLKLLESARKLQAWDKLKATWLANQAILTGRPSTRPYQIEVEKLLAVDRIRDLLASPTPDNRALQEAWDFLEEHGGHPTAARYQDEVKSRLIRRECLATLQDLLKNAPKSPTLAYDKKIVASCPPEHLSGMDQSSPLVKQYMAAGKRLKLVKKVHELEKVGTVESEKFIAGVAKRLPDTYHNGLARRSQQALRRLYAYRDLQIVQKGQHSEADIVRAWRRLLEARGRVLVSGKLKERVYLAEARLPLVEALDAIPESADLDEQERLVAENWEDALLHDCPDVARWKPIYDRYRQAEETVAAIREALAAENHVEVGRLMSLEHMQGRKIPGDLQGAIAESRSKAQQAEAARRQGVLNALQDNNRAAFAEQFDASLVAEICRQFRHHQPVVSQWVEAEILRSERLGLVADPATAVTRDEDGRLRLLWTWPHPQISTRCHLRICRKQPAPGTLPDDVEALHSVVLDHHDWNKDTGYTVQFDPEWHDALVLVWAVIDLGYQCFYSKPLKIGQIEPAPKQRRWTLFAKRGEAKPGKSEAGEAEGEPAETTTAPKAQTAAASVEHDPHAADEAN